ncbi:MAG: DUF4252 domain-containing protein [Candidatus Krumholzibacteria bacterium]|nr:DUF4252 domain-containing protein [Candidatus Krumholzibacteria bacterium]
MKGLHKMKVPTALIVIIGAVMLSMPALSAPDDEYKSFRGYVDFGELSIFEKVEPKVEVFIKGPLLKLCREAVKNEEPDLASALDNVKLIRVHVFPMEDAYADDLAKSTKKLAAKLEKKGWEIAVRVREENENVYVYMLPGKNEDIDGLVVMVVEDDQQAVFVNIVGTIDPEQIGRLSRSIDIEGLEMLDIESKTRTRDKKRERN